MDLHHIVVAATIVVVVDVRNADSGHLVQRLSIYRHQSYSKKLFVKLLHLSRHGRVLRKILQIWRLTNR